MKPAISGHGARTSNREAVFQAVVDLCASNQQATRKAISEATGLRMTIVDDHIKKLKADELIQLVINGVFEPVVRAKDRPVSGTIVPNGGYKLEIGDICLDLTLREARNVGLLTGGLGLQFGR